MKNYLAAAGALLLGTSSIAMAADVMKTPVQGGVEATKVTDVAAVQKSATVETAATDGLTDKSLTGNSAWSEEVTSEKVDPTKLTTASSTDSWNQNILDDAGGAKIQTAAADSWSSDLASAKYSSPGTTDAMQTGVGGPADPDGNLAGADLTSRPAAQNYPPCEPGPGDDRCIQLYERGVRAQLASWNSATGGLADGAVTTAMGGPYEPIQHHSDAYATGTSNASGSMASSSANGDGMIDAGMGETAELGTAQGYSSEVAAFDASAHQGVGGPVEVQSDYPACEPGPGDDRCIQLYERGVTGEAS
ncbi:hypothetical protein [Sphingosinicella terrae]|uniref:hypothetical protein n=1 Tax=Sphingosinicella terrae TaxID=2172047 RepID=UPI000E0DD2E0|nr:hypothetical protein [Sphingosinicella terrae]